MIIPANSPANPYSPFVSPYTPSVPAPTPVNPGPIMAWVQGEAGALQYPMAANTRAYLFDMNEERFFVKISDMNGVIQPLKAYEYHEVAEPVQEEIQSPEYITREEFDKVIASLRNNNYRKGDTHHGKQTVRGTNESGNDESVR